MQSSLLSIYGRSYASLRRSERLLGCFSALESVGKVVERHGLEMTSVAVAWVVAQPGVTSAIIGASRPDQLSASLAGAELELDSETAEACDAVWWELPRRPVIEGYR